MPNPDIQPVVAEPVAPAPLPQGKSVPTGQQQLRLAPTPPAKEPDARLPAAPKPVRKGKFPGWLMVVAVIVTLGGMGAWYWWQQQLNALPPYIAKANGRLEAEQVEIATKYPGRIAVVLAKEGDTVQAGAVLARMDTAELEAQLQSAKAQVRKAEAERVAAEAAIVQRISDRTFQEQEFRRTSTLNKQGWATGEKLDDISSRLKQAQANYDLAIATRDAATAAIAAGQGEVARLQAQIDDSTLIAPTFGRIQYKLAQPGEVLSAGGRVLTLLDLSDVYMTIFVPARVAGPLAIGDDARVTLDPDPGYVFPAKVTFVATEAQFTPKTVETPEEREKLMFRVKLSGDAALLTQYEKQLKTGIRGIGYVRTERDATWPDQLTVRLP
jgi:HlyD family secretion protein